MSCIPLAKPLTQDKLEFPVLLSRKYDGVPIRIDVYPDGSHEVRSRQNKPVPSVRTLASSFAKAANLPDGPMVSYVGELVLLENIDADFKDVSGIVRRNKDHSEHLKLMLFDCSLTSDYETRWYWMLKNIDDLHEQVNVVHQHLCANSSSMLDYFSLFMQCYPQAEGMVIRACNDPWSPGKRSWGYQKLLKEPTIDLRIIGVEEAIDKYGNPKGMAGRLIAKYHGKKIGIGPGKMSHLEREALWNYWTSGSFYPRIAEVKYKKDDSYDALRQPTFQCWRPDKEEPDA